MNVGPSPLVVAVDGKDVAWLAPSVDEAPGAGVVVRAFGGLRELSARTDDGAVVNRSPSMLASGALYLYAPAHGARCFVVHTDAYGAAKAPPLADRPLDGAASLWPIDERVDAWFAPNPPPDPRVGDSLTGGLRTAVRERRCER